MPELPPAPVKYDKDNEDRSRKRTLDIIQKLEDRVAALEANGGGTGTTPNPAPTASFDFTPVNLSVTFHDTSTDDGQIVAWAWDFGDAHTETHQNPSHTYATAGTYTVTLTVTDDSGNHGTLQRTVTVAVSGSPPVAAFTFTRNGFTIQCTDGSTDAGGSVVSWNWAFGDSQTSILQNPSHTYTSAGTYTITLLVTDNTALSSTVAHSVTINPNIAPIANFDFSRLASRNIAFTDKSDDPDGTIVSWAWTFGDNGTSTSRNPTHQYSAPGTFSVSLTVVDNSGAHSAAHTESIVVVNGLRKFIASYGLGSNLWGTRPTPDTVFTDQGGVNLVKAGGYIDDARAAGACIMVRGSGPNSANKTSDGSYDEAQWKLNVTNWANGVKSVNRTIGGVSKNGETILREAVRDGVFRAFYAWDDFLNAPSNPLTANGYKTPLTFAQIEGGSHFLKLIPSTVTSGQTWTWLPVIARGLPASLKTVAGSSSYQYLDAGWAQWRLDLDTNPVRWFGDQVTAGNSKNLGVLLGINMLDRGSGTDTRCTTFQGSGCTAWGCQGPHAPDFCAMSPAEVRDGGAAALANGNASAFIVYSYGPGNGAAYWSLPEINHELGIIYDNAQALTDRPLNIRGDLTPA